jgi:hypothetical protein
MYMRLGIVSTRWGWRVVLLLFQKVMGPVSFNGILDLIGKYESRICVKRHAKKNQEMYQMYDVYQNG